MSLTAKEVEYAKPGAKPIKLTDGSGLFLLIVPAGGKWWRFRYRFDKKHKTLALGIYPDVGLKEARERRYQARQQLAQGIDPSAVRREEKARDTAARLANQKASTVQVSVTLDGAVEIWKGRAVVRLTADEARAVNNLLTKLSLGDEPCL